MACVPPCILLSKLKQGISFSRQCLSIRCKSVDLPEPLQPTRTVMPGLSYSFVFWNRVSFVPLGSWGKVKIILCLLLKRTDGKRAWIVCLPRCAYGRGRQHSWWIAFLFWSSCMKSMSGWMRSISSNQGKEGPTTLVVWVLTIAVIAKGCDQSFLYLILGTKKIVLECEATIPPCRSTKPGFYQMN